MFQRTCHEPEIALKTNGPAIWRQGAPFDGGICPLGCPQGVATAFLARHLRPACKARTACTAHIAFAPSWPVDASLAPLRAGSRQHCPWPAADAGAAVPCAV